MQTDIRQPETAPLIGDNRQETAFSPDLASLIHDTCNMVSALDLYCEMLAEPEVLSAPFRHYADDLRLIGGSCRRLLEKMATVKSDEKASRPSLAIAPPPPVRSSRAARCVPGFNSPNAPLPSSLGRSGRRLGFLDGQPLESLAGELQSTRNLFTAVAGPGIAVSLSIEGGDRPVAMTRDDFSRVMVNLVKNAAEAMPNGGQIHIGLREHNGNLSLTVEDSGHGIAEDAVEAIFSSGYSTHSRGRSGSSPARQRGLGLSIVRSIVAAAGGSVMARNRCGVPGHAIQGAVIEMELPIEETSKTRQ